MIDKPKFKFVYAADLQPGSPYSFRFRRAWLENWLAARERIIAAAPDFMVIGGDITRDGYYHDFEFEEMKVSLDSMDIPYYCIPGNMDIGNKFTSVNGAVESRDDTKLNVSADRFSKFEEVFGPANWTFSYDNLQITGLCDILLGSGLPQEESLRDFLSGLSLKGRREHHFVLTHYALFIQSPEEEDYDITNLKQYHDYYFCLNKKERCYLLECLKRSGVTRVITGHVHCRREVEFDGIIFDFAPSTTFGQYDDKWPDGDASPGFYLFEVEDSEISKTFVPTHPLSDSTEGFGKCGHVNPDEIDYTESKAYIKKRIKMQNRDERCL